MNQFAPQHFGTGLDDAWAQRQEAQEREATKVSREITAILDSPAHGTDTLNSLFWRLAVATLEMARKIEKLERKVEKHHDWLVEGTL